MKKKTENIKNNTDQITMTAKRRTLKIFAIIGNVILYVIFALSFVLLGFSVASKKAGNEGMTIGNHQFMTIITESMDECEHTDVSAYEIKSLPVNTLISVENVPVEKEEANKWYSEIEVGDVLTFKYYYTSQEIITHRVVAIKENGKGGYIFTMEGDNKSAPDQQLGKQIIDTSEENTPNYIIGKVTWSSYVIGSILCAFKSKIGLIFIVIVPCALIIIYQIIKLITYFYNKKKKALEDNNASKDQEIEELKRKLLEAEGKKDETSSKKSDTCDDNK